MSRLLKTLKVIIFVCFYVVNFVCFVIQFCLGSLFGAFMYLALGQGIYALISGHQNKEIVLAIYLGLGVLILLAKFILKVRVLHNEMTKTE